MERLKVYVDFDEDGSVEVTAPEGRSAKFGAATQEAESLRMLRPPKAQQELKLDGLTIRPGRILRIDGSPV